MPVPASATSVGAGGRSPSAKSPGGGARSGGASGGGSTLRQRKAGGGAAVATRGRNAGGAGSMWRFYTEDSPGLKVGPVPVLVMSLLFIASVFMLHIWGKYTRS